MNCKRNNGLDLARIMAMIGIVILHILGNGGGLNRCAPDSAEYWVSCWVEICAYCSVDLFGLLSGWLAITKTKYSTYRVLELIGIVAFYSIIITICFLVFQPSTFHGWTDIVKGVAPPIVGRYWYITCYIPIALLQPFIHKMILSLSIKQHQMMCCLCVLVFGLIPALLRTDFFAMKEGYSFAWLLICYVIGAYLRRVDFGKKIRKLKLKTMGIYFGCSVGLLCGNGLAFHLFGKNPWYFVSYISPFVLLMAISILLFMRDFKVHLSQKCIVVFSSAAFDVYIIHCHILIYDNVIRNHFAWIVDLPPITIPLVVIGCAALIFVVLALVGKLRGILFAKAHINKLFGVLAKFLDGRIYVEVDRNAKYR